MKTRTLPLLNRRSTLTVGRSARSGLNLLPLSAAGNSPNPPPPYEPPSHHSGNTTADWSTGAAKPRPTQHRKEGVEQQTECRSLGDGVPRQFCAAKGNPTLHLSPARGGLLFYTFTKAIGRIQEEGRDGDR